MKGMGLMKSIDEEVKRDIVDQLYWDTRGDAANVAVEVEEGAVTLSGTVRSYAALQAAIADAWTTPGVASVENNIKTGYQVPIPDDQEIRERIEEYKNIENRVYRDCGWLQANIKK
jgi:hypothetical protein